MQRPAITMSAFLIVGAVFTLVGGVVLFVVLPNNRADIQALEALPVLDAARLSDTPDNTRAIIEGRISERNEKMLQELVTYSIYEYEDDGDSRSWYFQESVTPPLWIDVAGESGQRRLRVVNREYTLQNPPGRYEPEDRPQNGSLRYEGFRMGDSVTLVGIVVRQGDEREIHAEELFGGTAAGYKQYRREDLAGLTLLGGIFGGLGVLFLVIYVIIVWRLR